MLRQSATGPRVLIVPEFDPVEVPGEGTFAKYVLRDVYVRAVIEAGGVPLILPYLPGGDGRDDMLEGVLDACDALLLSGDRLDLDPASYGEAQTHRINGPAVERPRFELPLIERAMAREIPTLGICGGMQAMNVALGGALLQDIASQAPQAMNHEQKFDRRVAAHEVTVEVGTRLHAATGATTLRVNSTHHQAVSRLGRGLVVSARAGDGIVEAIEHTGARFFVGVQWHPELLDDEAMRGIYRALIEAAR